MSLWWYTLSEAPTLTILAGDAVREPVAYGGLFSQPGTITPPLVARVFSPSDPVTEVVTLDQAHSQSFLDQLNEPGSGSLTLQNDDPDLALISDGDLIRVEHYGWAALSFLAQDFTRVSVDQGEEASEATTLSGPGHLALLEGARVYPARGIGALPAEEDRRFNWSSVDFDDSSWTTATVMVLQGENDPGLNPQWYGIDPDPPGPVGWPDPTAAWVWASSGTPDASPPGFCYLRVDFPVPPAVAEAVIFATIDNGGDLAFDGQMLLEGMNDWEHVFTAVVEVDEGVHTIAVAGGNTPLPDGSGSGPGGVLVAVYARNPDGSLGDLLTHTDDTWQIIEFPGYAPGMTPTEVLRHVVEEAQARGELAGITLNFSDGHDSDGVPVPATADIATKTGTDVLTLVRELTGGPYLDVWMAPGGLELWAWVKGGRGQLTGVDFTPGVNLAHLEHQRVASLTNALLVRWHSGWHEVTDPVSIAAHGRHGGLLGLGSAQSIAEVERIATEQLGIYANPRTAILCELEPVDETDRPYPGFLVGDTVTVPDEAGEPTLERVLALTVAQDDDGQLSYAPELKDLLLEEQERHEQALKKMSEGTMRGDSKVASPVSQLNTSGSSKDCCPPQPVKGPPPT